MRKFEAAKLAMRLGSDFSWTPCTTMHNIKVGTHL